MPRTKTYLTASEYAVLGLLRQRPTYGYELKQQLTGGRGLARVCPVEPAMVYAILKSLSGLELIDGEWDNSTYPPRAIYAANAEGDAEFQRWLRRPVGRMREVRLDFLVKLYFALEEDLELASELVAEQIDACQNYGEQIESELVGVEPGSFEAIALTSKASAARITQEWLLQCRRDIEARSRKGTEIMPKLQRALAALATSVRGRHRCGLRRRCFGEWTIPPPARHRSGARSPCSRRRRLTEAFTELAQAFETQYPGVHVRFNFAGTPTLRTQLEQGARADVFASANLQQMDLAKASGVVEANHEHVRSKLAGDHHALRQSGGHRGAG